MLLAQVRVVHVGPFDDLTISFADAYGSPRRSVVLFGGEGVGKTSLLSAIASTRPGYAVAQLRAKGDETTAPCVVTDWILGDDDPLRKHPLRIASPNAKLDETDEAGMFRRREQALFDKRAVDRGFSVVSFSGVRWFSRAAVLLTTPERTILRHDVRMAPNFDDPTRADLTRETKQVLSFTSIAAALCQSQPRLSDQQATRLEKLESGLTEVLSALLDGSGYRYLGVDPIRLEPIFESDSGRRIDFDDLGRSTRHLLAFGVLTFRSLAAAHPESDVQHAEGVVLLDDIESQQDLKTQHTLVSRLRHSLPRVQWIVTTSSTAVAVGCDLSDVVVLRREATSGQVRVHEGPDAIIH